jgi:hypothetical protein
MFNFKTTIMALLLIVFALPIGNHIFHSLFYIPAQKKSVEDLEKYYPKILADLKLVDQNPIFNKFTFEKNAEEIFEKNLSWSSSPTDSKLDLNHINLRDFVAKYSQWKKEPEVLEQMLADPSLNTIDVSWLESVLNYDHWNVSNNPHVKIQLDKIKGLDSISKLGVFASLPIPDFLELRNWTLVYFLKQHKKKNTAHGFKVYRKIAELTYSSSSTVSSIVATKLLEDESYLNQIFPVADWKPIDDNRIKAFKRLSWAWLSLVRNTANKPLTIEVRDLLKFENGICSAAWELAPNIALMNDFLEPQFILETNHALDVSRFKETIQSLQTTCRLNPYKKFNERSPSSIQSWLSDVTTSFAQAEFDGTLNPKTTAGIRRLPYLRRMFVYIIFPFGAPESTLSRHYEN